jgi:UDP-GlcNAc:undecaprenyl-phosphate GlcNAc-1-phosphate transferase
LETEARLTMAALLELNQVTIRFGGLTAVSELSTHVGERELVGLIGPNGAGKTTTLDLVLAVIRRTRAGRLPFSADQGHLHHRMLDMGHSHRTSVLLLWAWAAVVAFGVVLVGLIRGPWPVVAVSVAVVCCLVGTLVTPTRIRRRRRRRQRERVRAA